MEADLENVPAINIWIWITIWNTDILFKNFLKNLFKTSDLFDFWLCPSINNQNNILKPVVLTIVTKGRVHLENLRFLIDLYIKEPPPPFFLALMDSYGGFFQPASSGCKKPLKGPKTAQKRSKNWTSIS